MNSAVFYCNLCIICQQPGKNSLQFCQGCKMVPYCSENHKKRHWKKHKKLCEIIQKVGPLLACENLEIKENWFQYRTNFMILCELMMSRKLLGNEMNMILFPRSCEVCHVKDNLVDCEQCLCVSYCSDEHLAFDVSNHNTLCSQLSLCRTLDLHCSKTPATFKFCAKTETKWTEDLRTFMIENIKIIDMNEDEASSCAMASEVFTCPLSVLYGLTLVNFEPKSSLVIHVLGSCLLESVSIQAWEMLLHIHPQLKSLKIVLIGPEVEEVEVHEVCEDCQGVVMEVECKALLYQEYVRCEGYVTPNVICAFNCGLHEFEGTDSDTWADSLSYIVQPDVPLILTSFTETEADKDVARLFKLNHSLNLIKRKNSFASLRPFRDLESLGVYFNNNYISIITT